ncbi:MAG: dicarboxylate/amino acid:cation symporter [Puniceicoccales bacterium]|jgi:Na+/H+-dicarboxylate symporter|nr:dicarboxylate/amino acid:cation symporter [Puniceicoccales bacterium]
MKKFIMPIIFLFTLVFPALYGHLLPDATTSFFYALSLTIKECIIFVLPLVIFSLLYTSFGRIGVGSLRFLIFIAPLICFSNFINTLLSYLLSNGCIKIGILSVIPSVQQGHSSVIPLFSFSLPPIISNDLALLAGVLGGIASSLMKFNKLHARVSMIAEKFMKCFFKLLIPLMPLFIFGTALKLNCDEMISLVLSKYLVVMEIFVFSAYGYVLLQLFVLSGFHFGRWIDYLKNLLPAVVTGFGSMSSAAALPLSIKAAEANLKNKDNTAIIVPLSVNIHLVGDCFFIPFVAVAILTSFGQELPNISTYLVFAVHFIMAKFAVAAVPGGGILVMLPILQNYLGFNADMLGLITALYVLFDPFITACNVTGNGSLAIIFDKITKIGKSVQKRS